VRDRFLPPLLVLAQLVVPGLPGPSVSETVSRPSRSGWPSVSSPRGQGIEEQLRDQVAGHRGSAVEVLPAVAGHRTAVHPR
jgi:hypothetical protein